MLSLSYYATHIATSEPITLLLSYSGQSQSYIRAPNLIHELILPDAMLHLRPKTSSMSYPHPQSQFYVRAPNLIHELFPPPPPGNNSALEPQTSSESYSSPSQCYNPILMLHTSNTWHYDIRMEWYAWGKLAVSIPNKSSSLTWKSSTKSQGGFKRLQNA